MSNSDFLEKERISGNKAARALQQSFRSKIAEIFKKDTGESLKSTFSARYREGRLDRLVLKAPHYTFKQHYGSILTGTTPSTHRKETIVSAFTRYVNGEAQEVVTHRRRATQVKAHIKGIDYKATNHIAEALRKTSALETLATELGENRIVLITSQIDF